MRWKWIAACALLSSLALSCADVRRVDPSPDQRRQIVEEINQTLDEYLDANVRLDMEAILALWRDSDEFVYAGDGVILGGYEEWTEALREFTAETDAWVQFEHRNRKVAVLSHDAASCTVEFNVEKITKDGSNVKQRGTWTYVFKKYDGRWRVIQTNGTHIDS